MRYQGSKTKMGGILQDLVYANIKEGQWYIEPFGGGMNSFSVIDHPLKMAIDINPYLIEFWNSVKNGTFTQDKWDLCKNITEDEYYKMKYDCINGIGYYNKDIIGYVAFACSYGGGWWNGYAKFNPKKKENHIIEAYNGTMKQIENFKNLSGSCFINGEYNRINLPEKSFIYCDPPYCGTKKYANSFNNDNFWEWARKKVQEGNTVMVSEFSAPNDWKCIWQKNMQCGMSYGNENKIEKIFVHESENQFRIAI